MAMKNALDLQMVAEFSLNQPIGQCRAVPVRPRRGVPEAILVVYSADFDIDPSHEMFFFPKDTLKLALITQEGKVLWRRDLGRGVVPGVWFCPVFAFDLNGDGADEIFYVGNEDSRHPLSKTHRRLVCLDARTGETIGQWPWPHLMERQQELSFMYRDFIFGGYAKGEPVLVTAQGTYMDMFLQGWRADMTQRWQRDIIRVGEQRSAAGSHQCAIVDINHDGIDEVMWGERCIELSGGQQIFCADDVVYRGHSDLVQPMLGPDGRWRIFTIRESHPEASPRVVMFDDLGRRLWGHVDAGHIDMGWVARLGPRGEHVAAAIRIGEKSCGPDGRFHQQMDEFAFDALSGEPMALGFSHYRTLPVDLNGDGRHELVRGLPSGAGEVLSRDGEVVGTVGGATAMACKFLDRPGEQLLSYHGDGAVRIWADANAHDTPAALQRYAHPFYARNRALTACGYNWVNLGGV